MPKVREPVIESRGASMAFLLRTFERGTLASLLTCFRAARALEREASALRDWTMAQEFSMRWARRILRGRGHDRYLLTLAIFDLVRDEIGSHQVCAEGFGTKLIQVLVELLGLEIELGHIVALGALSGYRLEGFTRDIGVETTVRDRWRKRKAPVAAIAGLRAEELVAGIFDGQSFRDPTPAEIEAYRASNVM